MTKNPLCGECYLQGYCRRLKSNVVMPYELTPIFVGNVRELMGALQISRDGWVPYLDAAYRDYPGRIVNAHGNEVRLNTRLFDHPSIRYWFRDLCAPIADGVTPRLRREAKGRFIVVASILRAVHPISAMLWHKEVANDLVGGVRPFVSRKGDECRYRHFVISS